MSLSRRTLLQATGLLAFPIRAVAASPAPALLHVDERVTLSAIADALLPRTDSPGALDVGAPAFVELLIGEWASESDRTLLRDGLRDLEAHAVATHGRGWAALDAAQREAEIAWGERSEREPQVGQRAFRRLKSWITHAWLTSERVQKEVLRVNITPGAYEGCVPRPSLGGRD